MSVRQAGAGPAGSTGKAWTSTSPKSRPCEARLVLQVVDRLAVDGGGGVARRHPRRDLRRAAARAAAATTVDVVLDLARRDVRLELVLRRGRVGAAPAADADPRLVSGLFQGRRDLCVCCCCG